MAEYIDKEDLIKQLEERPMLPFVEKNFLIGVLSVVPSADVQPVKHGKWLPIIEANEYGDAYQCGTYCSECGETLQSEPNFCPNCGADMRGEP